MPEQTISIEKTEIARSRNRYFCNPCLCEFGDRGYALIHHDSPARESPVKLDPKAVLEFVTGASPLELARGKKRTVPRMRICGSAPSMSEIGGGRYLITDNLWHIYNWMGEQEAKIIYGPDWVVLLRGAITMVVDASGERVMFGKPRFVRRRDYPVVSAYDAPVIMPGGSILLACDYDEHASQKSDYPWESVIMRSEDLGQSWRLIGMTYCQKDMPDLPKLKRPSLVDMGGGRLICALSAVEDNEDIHICFSENDGGDWTVPGAAGFRGRSHSMRLLRDGRLLMTYSPVEKPFGVKARLSDDGGKTWPDSNILSIESESISHDCGHARTIQDNNGDLFITYYSHVSKDERAVYVARLDF